MVTAAEAGGWQTSGFPCLPTPQKTVEVRVRRAEPLKNGGILQKLLGCSERWAVRKLALRTHSKVSRP